MAAIILASGSATAEKFDESKLLEVTRKDCPSQFMHDKKFIDALLIGGGNISGFCECLAVRFVAQLDDADYGNEASVAAKWGSSAKFCLAVSIK
jgi:hypothetical protein